VRRARSAGGRAIAGAACAASLALAFGAPRARADDDPATTTAAPDSPFASADEEWIVSGTRIREAGLGQPFPATVLEGERLDVGISPTVSDALRFVPGLNLVQDGAPGGRAALSLRGLDPNHVVVLVDGVRVNDPTNSRGGSFDPSTLALVDVERIEVVRGPLSSIHGADALAGVVQIVSRGVEPDAPYAARVRARRGRYHMGEVAGQASAGLGGWAGLSLGAAGSTSRDPHSDGGFDAASLHAKLRVPLPLESELELFTRLHDSSARSFPESSGGPELAVLRAMEDRNVREILFGAALEQPFPDGAGHVRFAASRASRREDLESPGIVPLGDPASGVPPTRAGDEYERWDVSLVADAALPAPAWLGGRGWPPRADAGPGTAGEDTRVVVGLAAIVEDGESDTRLDFGGGYTPFPFYENRDTYSAFAEVEQPIGPFVAVSGSLRFDATPDDEDRLSPAVGVVSEIPGTPFSVFGRYGQGYRRPSFYALGNPLVGNPGLRVERSRGFEAGLRWRAWDARFSGQLGYFDLEVENLHDFDAAIFQLVNRGRLISRGVELELDLRPHRLFELAGAVSFNPTDLGGTGRPPLDRPRWRGFAELRFFPRADWTFLLRALAVGPSKASAAAIDGRIVTLAGYERIDARAAWTPVPGLDVFLEIENLTNRTHRETVGFESPGIAPRVGVALYR